MTDRYIDADETLIYGSYAAKKIRSVVRGLVPEFDKGLDYAAEEIEHATSAMSTAIASARTADGELRKGFTARGPALGAAIDVLGRFSRHLEAHKSGEVDRKLFFTADGTAGGVGRSATRVLLVLTHISGELKKKTCTVRDKETWKDEITAAIAHLSPAIEHADSARTERRAATPEVEAARQAWLHTYRAARSSVEGVLRFAGKLDLLSTVFYDLAVPATAKVTAPPVDTSPGAPASGGAPS